MTIRHKPFVQEDFDAVRAVSRSLAAVAVTAVAGGQESPQQWLVRHWPDWARRSGTIENEIVCRATSAPASTTGWGAQVLPTLVGSFLSGLAPQSAAVQLFEEAVRLDFAGAHIINVPRASTSATPVFIGEGDPMPMKQDVFASVAVGPVKKMLLGAALTGELEFYAAESAVAIIERVMREQAGKSLDAAVFSTTAADATRPAGLLNGVTPITASTATPLDQAMFRDIEALAGAIADAGGGTNMMLFANPRQATTLKLKVGPAFDLPIVPAPTLAAGTVVAIEADAIASGYDGLPQIDVSKEFTAHLEDTTPAQLTTNATTWAFPIRSGWQTNVLGLRLRLKCAWAPLAPGMVQVVNSVTW